MFTKCFSVTSWVMIASLLALAACSPATGSTGMAVQNTQSAEGISANTKNPSNQTPAGSEGLAVQNSQGTEGVSANVKNPSNQTSTGSEGLAVQNTQGTEGVITLNIQGTEVVSSNNGNPSNQPGSNEPGAAEGSGEAGPGTQVVPTPSETPSGTWLIYTDSIYKFSVLYPPDFVSRTLSAEKLTELNPKPAAVFTFMNPTTASSNVPDELADLEIRVYNPAGVTSLDQWLNSFGLTLRSGSPQPFSTSNVSGVKVCSSTLVVPPCRYFVIGNSWVYQLTPITLDGETMLKSFKLVP
jgi:hypothetical protein